MNDEWAWQDDAERFRLFEQVRKARDVNRSVHDCKESNCTIDPFGIPIFIRGNLNPLARWSIRPPLDATSLANIQKLRNMGIQI